MRVYVGTYTGGQEQGHLPAASWTRRPASSREPELAGEAANPSFLAIHPTGKFLYAVGEVDDFDGKKAGGGQRLRHRPGQRRADAAQPAVLRRRRARATSSVDATGTARAGRQLRRRQRRRRCPIGADGQLGEPPRRSSSTTARASTRAGRRGRTPTRSTSTPATASPSSADLGLDKVMVYRFDPATATLTPNDPPSASVPPGAGPRHFAFHPSGRFAYVINEMDSTRHRVRLRRREGRADGDADGLRRCPPG